MSPLTDLQMFRRQFGCLINDDEATTVARQPFGKTSREQPCLPDPPCVPMTIRPNAWYRTSLASEFAEIRRNSSAGSRSRRPFRKNEIR